MQYNTLVRDELRSFCKQWGISQRPRSVTDVMHAYLACSLALQAWTDVYVEIFGSADCLLLDAKRAAYPSSVSAAETFNKRHRDANVYATIFSGTVIPADDVLEANPSYMAFRAAVGKAMHPFTVGHVNVVTIMHLVGDVRELNTLMEDPGLGFKVRGNRLASPHAEVAKAVWKFDTQAFPTFARDMASIIVGCNYDACLTELTVDDVWSDPKKKNGETKSRAQKKPMGMDVSTSLHKTQFPRHEPLPWDIAFERSVADNARFMALKKALGKPVFCNNKQLAQEYLVYATVGDSQSPTTCEMERTYRADFASMNEDELSAMLAKFAERMNAAVVCELDEVVEFERILIQFGNPTQQRDWTTRELLVHLFMAYHPKWKQMYSARWNHDKPLLDAVELYLKKRPSISPLVAIGMFL
jgi:hypothetical protein